jgi:hypothetical protein
LAAQIKFKELIKIFEIKLEMQTSSQINLENEENLEGNENEQNVNDIEAINEVDDDGSNKEEVGKLEFCYICDL